MALSRELAVEALVAGGLANDRDQGGKQVDEALDTGRAAERFGAMVEALGGPSDFVEHPERHLPQAPVVEEVFAGHPGFVAAIDVRALGMAVVDLGGGRRRAEDHIDPAVGLTGLVQIGDEVGSDRPLARIHARSAEDATQAAEAVRKACRIAEQRPRAVELISQRLTPGES